MTGDPHLFPPSSATVQTTFGAHSRQGRLRSVNEDHYLILRLGRYQETLLTNIADKAVSARFDEYGYAMVVADGMGGTGSGAEASQLAIATLVHLVRHFSKWNLRVDDAIASEVIARAERFYRHVDSAVTQLPWTDEGRPIQTTLTATFSAGRDLFFAHVGHSRAYLLRDRSLLRLTRDHTVRRAGSRLAPVTPLGPLVDVNDTARDLKHILTNTIGMRGRVGPTIDLEHVQLDDNDRVLVCTNGLTDSIDDDRIAEVLSSGQTPDEQCRVLVDLAMASGGDDDVTAIVGSYRIPVSE